MRRQEFFRCLDFIKNGNYFEEGCKLDLSEQPNFEKIAWEVFEIVSHNPEILSCSDKVAKVENLCYEFKKIDETQNNIITDKEFNGKKTVMYLDWFEVSTVKELMLKIVEDIYKAEMKEKSTFEYFAMSRKIRLLEDKKKEI